MESSFKFTKVFRGNKWHYCFNGNPFRSSKRDFKFGCYCLSRETGNAWPVSLGNLREQTLFSMRPYYHHYCDMFVVDVLEEK